MRLFVGIPVAAPVAEQLAAIRARLEKPGEALRWSNPESWHITLQFLGAATASQYSCLLSHLQEIAAAPFEIQLEGLGFFDRAGVFFDGVQPSPELQELQQRIIAATAPCGYEPENRSFHPHVTLARVKGRSDDLSKLKSAVESLAKADSHFKVFTATEFLLYESLLGPAGSRYEVRARFSLNLA